MLAVGRELLIGRTLNTNAQWIGRRLARKGITLAEVTTVDDDLEEIESGLKTCLRRRPDLVVVVGGLGPTPDDMTLKGVSGAIGRNLRLNKRALGLIREHYVKRDLANIELTPARKKMAVLPAGAEAVPNDVGTAPGVRLVTGDSVVYCLPGVPAEMKDIFRKTVEPEIVKRLGRLHRRYISMKIKGIYESALAPMISEQLKRHPEAYIKSHPRGIKEGQSRIELDVAVVNESMEKADATADRIASDLKKKIEAAGATIVAERRTAP